ncbi:MAG TPA: hypothetical protein VKW78_17895 [Terriglobales bacterium]|nr:hypothetical protein [Terriglobales bacterium]
MNRQKPKESWDDFSQRVGRDIGKAANEAEKEAEKLISYLNAEVVPAVRAHSTKALRIASQKMADFADYLDDQRKKS